MDTDYVEIANGLRAKGYNCAQAVVCAFVDQLSLDELALYKLAEGFGGGMGRPEGLCGAISGGVMVVSSLHSGGNPAESTKLATYALVKELYNRFVEKNGSSVCTTLRGLDSGIELRSCLGCIEDAVIITNEILRREEAK